VLATAGEVIEQLFGAFISWHTCTLKSRRRIASPEIRTKRMSIFKLQHGMAGHKMLLRRSNMRKRANFQYPLYLRKRTWTAGLIIALSQSQESSSGASTDSIS
jgi:hypothetical protein